MSGTPLQAPLIVDLSGEKKRRPDPLTAGWRCLPCPRIEHDRPAGL